MRRKISISSVKITKSQAFLSRTSSVFGLVVAGKEMELDAGDDASANLWKHAIECAMNRAFDKDLPAKYKNRNRNSLPATGVTSTNTNTNNNGNNGAALNSAYLNIGRQNQGNDVAQHNNNNNNNANSATRSSNTNSNLYKNPYWMLLLCKLETASGPDGAVFLGNVPNPATMDWWQVDYAFTLEKEVLEKDAARS
mmetsp:Transcript_10450/g.8049  ORF Transcript_10450/g.8049 Transcript_10450/m.8049 type:complete len:196 (-) Transcript_10450:22-609(-)